MHQQPLVSVVTVTYNSAKFVRDSIESILHSNYPNIELIIGDDCSTDETWAIINQYGDHRIVKYKNENNMGEYANRNKAIDLAQGEYLIFIDGDDMIYPHGLDFLVKMLQAFPQCAMAFMWWYQREIFFPAILTPEQFYIGEYFGKSVLGSAFTNVFFRTEVLKRVGGLSTDYQNGDDFIRYKIASSYPVLLVNDNITWWRESPDQASKRFQRSANYVLESFRLKFNFLCLPEAPLSTNDKAIALKNLRITVAIRVRRDILKGNWKRARLLINKLQIPLRFVFNFLLKIEKRNPFAGFDEVNIYKLPLDLNPFSVQFHKKDK